MKTKKHHIFNWIQRKLSAFVLLCPIFIHGIWSQNQPLDINQCYTIALENSPKLQTKILDILSNDVLIEQAKMQFLPSLNAGATHGYNWGQSIDPFTNTFATGRVRTNNFSVRSTWEIFTGLMNRYRLNLTRVNKLTAEEILLLETRNFKNEIATVYAKLQTDYLVKSLYDEQLALVRVLYDNVAAKEKSGKKSPFDKLRIKALVQQDSAAVLAAENTIRYSEFVLRQLLNSGDSIKALQQFEILDEGQLTQRLRAFSSWTVDSLPEVRLAQLNKENAALAYKINKAQLLPSLALHSAIGSGYSGRNEELIGTTLVPKPMDVQLRENLFQTAVLSLSIPIFNAYQVKSQVKLAQIKMQQTELEYQQTQIDLINAIERLLLDYENENINRKAMQLVYSTNQELFVASEKMFVNGILNYAEYVEAKYSVTQARLDYLISLSKCYGILLILENIIA